MFKSTASQVIGAQLITAADGTAFTGSVVVRVTKDGGSQALGNTGSGACVSEGNGFHSYVADATDTAGDHLAFTFTGTGAIPVTVQVYTQDKAVADRLAAGAKAMVYGTVGSGTNNTTTISISGGSGAISPASAVTDQFKGRIILFTHDTTTTNLRGQGAPVDGSTSTAITIAAGNALTTAPANGDTFVIA
jgi:hypothetical protein